MRVNILVTSLCRTLTTAHNRPLPTRMLSFSAKSQRERRPSWDRRLEETEPPSPNPNPNPILSLNNPTPPANSGTQISRSSSNFQEYIATRPPAMESTDPAVPGPWDQRQWDPLHFDHYGEHADSWEPEPSKPNRRLLITSIPPTSTEEELKAVFSSYRPHLKEVRIVRDRNGDSRGFGFLTFDTLEQAVRVYNSGEDVPFHLDGNDLELSYHKDALRSTASGPIRPDRGLYITGLDWNATETDVKDFFSQFGPVESVYIGRFPDGRSRGLAIVVFDHIDDAVNVYESNEAEPYFFLKRHLKISYKANPTSTLQHKKTDTVALVGAKPLVEAEVKALVDGFNVKKVDLNSPRIQYITLVKFEDAKTASQAYDEINRRKVKSANILYSMFVDGSEASGRKQGNAADDQWPCS